MNMEQAIAAYTTGSAFAEFAEKDKGTLAPGMLADLVVLDRDITSVAPEKILGTKVSAHGSGRQDGVPGQIEKLSNFRITGFSIRQFNNSEIRQSIRPCFVCYSSPVSRSLKAHILLVLVTLIWGSNFVVIKNALADISPLFFNAVRMSLAAVVLAVVFYRELGRFTAAALRSGLLVGVFLFIGNELQTVGLKYTTPSKSAFLTGVSVVLVPVLLALFWKRGLNRWTAAAWSSRLPACTC